MPADPGQHHVEQHEVGVHGVEQVEGLRAVAGDLHPEALPPEADGQGVDEGLLVLHDQHGASARSCHPASRDRRGGPAAVPASGTRRVNVEPSPSTDVTDDLSAVVGHHVAHDGEPEPGAAGLAAPGLVDPVEALEDAVQVAAGDADAVVVHAPAPTWPPSGGTSTSTVAPGSEYFTAFSTRLPTAETSWRRLPTDVAPGSRRRRGPGCPESAASGACTRRRPPGRRRPTVDHLGQRLAAQLDAGQLEQVVDDAGQPVGLGDQLRREAAR